MIDQARLDVSTKPDELDFTYGPGTVGPITEKRRLDAIRPSLLNPQCSGPDPVYGIAMDVARGGDLSLLRERMLLYGIVIYAAGRLGEEPTRSQGHVHAIVPHSGWSPPELFEIKEGKAIVYAQMYAEDNPGPCIAVTAEEGDKVVVPPSWAHCVINADPTRHMVFAAWCDRGYAFVYDGVRNHGGLAWFPVLTPENHIEWRPNLKYEKSKLDIRSARNYPELGVRSDCNLYEQFVNDPDSVIWVSDPASKQDIWPDFRP